MCCGLHLFQIYLKTAGQAWPLWHPHLLLTQSCSLGQGALLSFSAPEALLLVCQGSE